jgi:hypothetical protein
MASAPAEVVERANAQKSLNSGVVVFSLPLAVLMTNDHIADANTLDQAPFRFEGNRPCWKRRTTPLLPPPRPAGSASSTLNRSPTGFPQCPTT